MSSIIGGDLWFCTYVPLHPMPSPPPGYEGEGIGPSLIVEANSAAEAADIVHAKTGATQVNCTRN